MQLGTKIFIGEEASRAVMAALHNEAETGAAGHD